MDYTSKPALQSVSVWGALIAIAGALTPLALSKSGVTDPGQQQAAVTTAAQLVTAVGGAVALYGRIKATKKIG